MWRIFAVIAYFVLALLIPILWAEMTVWRKTRASRRVTCPHDGTVATVGLDPWYAMRMHALGNPEAQVRQCSRWPHGAPCGQDCRAQFGSTV